MKKPKKQQKPAKIIAPRAPLYPLITGVCVTLFVLGLFNAQFVSALVINYIVPGGQAVLPPTDVVANDTRSRLVIPKINLDVPVVFGMDSVQEADVQRALESGVLHFGGSAQPGYVGNSVYVGHSSGQPWAPGDYKFVFIRLGDLELQDEIYVQSGGVLHTYVVSSKEVVRPDDVSVLESDESATATFITCWPIGTNAERMVVKTQLVNPEPKHKDAAEDFAELNAHLTESNLPGKSYDVIQSIQQLAR